MAGRAAAQCVQPVFAEAPGYAAGLSPFSVAAGEFNGDGVTDLAVANINSSNVSVLLGDGAGGFGPPANFQTSQQPWSVAVGDFNKDGKADLAVGHSFGGGPVSALFGDGAGRFSAAVVVANINGPTRVSVADLNGDTNPDIAVGVSQGVPRILLGDGAGGFSARTLSISTDSKFVTTGEFNGDGIADAAFSGSGFPGEVLIVHGNSGGSFNVNARVAFDQTTKALAAKDLNGDGRDDIVATVEHFEARLAIAMNNGAGSFGAPAYQLTNFEPNSVAVADFNGDTKPDVAVASPVNNSVRVYAGNGLGSFAAQPTQYLTGKSPQALIAGDFNGDSKADLVSADAVSSTRFTPPTGTVSVLLGDGAGAFATARSYMFTNFPGRIVAGDFNNNGRSDLASPFAFSSLIMVSLDDGAGGLNTHAFLTSQNTPAWLAAGDFNGDGNLDLVAANEFSNSVSIFFGNGAGQFTSPLNVSVSNVPIFVAAGNFNGDARADIVVGHRPDVFAGNGNGTIIVLLANNSGGFDPAPGSPFTTGANLGVGDFNGDGRDDLAAAGSPANSVSVLLNDGTGRMTAASTLPLPVVNFTELRVATADLNHDGLADVVTANSQTSNVTVFLATGAGNLGAGTNYSVNSGGPLQYRPFDIKIADFDADTHADVVVSNGDFGAQQGHVALLRGDGAGALAPAVTYTSGGTPGFISVGDFNGDARPDLAATGGSRTLALLTNISSAALPCLSVGDATVTEGDTGTVNASFNVTLSAPSAETVRVNYSLVDTTTIAGADYNNAAGRLVFAPGETSKTVTVQVRGDALDEVDETFRVILTSPSNAAIGDGEGLGTIIDDDPLPTLKINDIAFAETGFLTRNFTVTLSAPSGRAVTVQYATADGTAVSGTQTNDGDYFQASGTLTIPAGQTSAGIGVVAFGDNAFEPDENFFVNLSNATNATIEDAQGEAVIQNDDPIPSVFANPATVLEGDTGTQDAPLTLILSNPSSLPITISYATADGTATAGVDYVAASGTVTFDPFETSKTIPFAVIGDTLDEVDEHFFIDLSNAQNVTITNSRLNGFISDDDGPSVSVNDITVDEGESGTTNAVFTLTLSAASPQNITVRVTADAGTATPGLSPAPGVDFRPGVFNVTIPAGTLTRQFPVAVFGDNVVEPDEDFFVTLSQPFRATIADAQGVAIIKNDDPSAFRFSAATFAADEAAHFVNVNVTRTGDTTVEGFVSYATADGTATERKDYISAAGRLRFAPGETTKSIAVLVTDDRFDDDNESFQITLSNPSGGVLSVLNSATVNINDDDSAHGPSPVKDASFNTEFFVRQHYADFLNRVPDQDGLNFWTNQVTFCGAADPLVCRINVSAAFFLSIENQETGYLTYRAHKAAYGNLPGKPVPLTLREHLAGSRRIGEGVEVGIGDWQQRLEENKQAFFNEFVATARFAAVYNALNHAQYVDALNQNTGGALSQAERDALVAALTNDTRTRAQVLRAVAEDADFATAERNRAFVLAQYFGYLRRDPEDTDFRGVPDPNFDGYNFWLNKLNQFNGNFIDAEMVRAFIESIEYGERFGR